MEKLLDDREYAQAVPDLIAKLRADHEKLHAVAEETKRAEPA